MSGPSHHTDAAPAAETPHPHPSPQPHFAKPRVKPVRLVLGILGWLAAGGLLLYAVTLPGIWRTKEAKLRESLAQLRQERLDGAAAEVLAAREKRNAGIQAVNAEIEARNVIKQEAADGQGRLLRLKDDQANVERDLAAKKDELKALGSNAELKGAGKKVESLRRERNRLVAEYRALLADLRRDFLERLNTRKPERMRQFYSARQNTPFGPAALFYAAEFLYESRNSKDASRLYKELLRKYPDSAYLDAVRTRQVQIQAHEPYVRKDDLGLYLYRALIMNEDAMEINAASPVGNAL